MFRFFVCIGGGGIAIRFHQHEPRWVILLLNDVETRYARFLEACARIGQRRFFESLHVFRFDMDMNVNYEHKETDTTKARKSSSASKRKQNGAYNLWRR